MVTDAELQGFQRESDRRHAENREAITEVKTDVHQDLMELEARMGKQFTDLKDYLDSTAIELKESTAVIAKAVRDEENTWRTEHAKADDLRWQGHTGKDGVHDQIVKTRDEDHNRIYTWMQVGAIVFAAVIGCVVAWFQMHPV